MSICRLLLLAFMGSLGMASVVIPCLMNQSWWPLIVVLFYILAPLPTLCVNGYSNDPRSSYMDLAIFITMGLVVSSFALPIVMTRADPKVIDVTACFFTLVGNVVIYSTFVGYFLTLFQDNNSGGYF